MYRRYAYAATTPTPVRQDLAAGFPPNTIGPAQLESFRPTTPASGCFMGLPKIKNSCYILPGIAVVIVIVLFMMMRKKK